MSRDEYEAAGAKAAHECLDSILNSTDQGAASRYLLGLLNGLSGKGKAAKGARRGATTILVNAIERGPEAIRSEGGR